jgi:hypothetical protein
MRHCPVSCGNHDDRAVRLDGARDVDGFQRTIGRVGRRSRHTPFSRI